MNSESICTQFTFMKELKESIDQNNSVDYRGICIDIINYFKVLSSEEQKCVKAKLRYYQSKLSTKFDINAMFIVVVTVLAFMWTVMSNLLKDNYLLSWISIILFLSLLIFDLYYAICDHIYRKNKPVADIIQLYLEIIE